LSLNCNKALSRLPGSLKLTLTGQRHCGHVDVVILESCHSTWIFDTDHKQFCRILKDVEGTHRPVSTDWRPYAELDLDPSSESFTVHLNATHTRQIRSWRHTRDCDQCGGHETAELPLDDIRRAVHLYS
jgi:hypothetical protein